MPSPSNNQAPSWQSALDEGFPGWLLPDSAGHALDAELAERFLSRLTGRADHLALLRAASFFNAYAEQLKRFVHHELPALVQVLPAQTYVEQRTWEGAFHGRLDIQATQRLHHAGQPTRFVTRSRRRDFALPENLLLRAVCHRLQVELDRILKGRDPTGWLEDLAELSRALRELTLGSVLREIPLLQKISGRHRTAARQAAHAAYPTAATLAIELCRGLDSSDPVQIAQLLADGALWPLREEKRFELAVLLRLVQALAVRLRVGEDSAWRVEHCLIIGGRNEVVRFERQDGASLTLWYDVAALPGGLRKDLVGHILGHGASQRPDLTLCAKAPDGACEWTLVEIKQSSARATVAQGIDEALLYTYEYAPYLGAVPRALLVTEGGIVGDLDLGRRVAAVPWSRWVPREVVDGLVGGCL